jgi:MFS family permease
MSTERQGSIPAGAANASVPTGHLSSDFWKFWIGQTISNLGSSFTGFALPLLVFRLTGSALNLAISSATSLLPILLFGLLIGAWVDRANRKQLMIASEITRALVIASIPLLTALQLLSIWWIYAVGFIATTLAMCFGFAQVTAVASLVRSDDLVTANGRIHASFSATSVLGPLLAGLLVALVPLPAVLLADSCSFLVSAFSLALIRTNFNPTGEHRPASWQRGISEGLHYVLRHPVLRPIAAIAALVNVLAVTIGTQLVVFAKEQLHVSDAQLGLLYAAESSDVVLLSLAAGPLSKRWPFSKVALGAIILYGMLTVSLAVTHTYSVAIPLLALTNGLIVLFSINVISLRQALVPNQLLGRVTSTLNVVASSATPAGVLLGGVAIERTQNVGLVYGVIGVLIALVGIGFSFTTLGHAEQYLPTAATE